MLDRVKHSSLLRKSFIPLGSGRDNDISATDITFNRNKLNKRSARGSTYSS
jgi:hypothetical protein